MGCDGEFESEYVDSKSGECRTERGFDSFVDDIYTICLEAAACSSLQAVRTSFDLYHDCEETFLGTQRKELINMQ